MSMCWFILMDCGYFYPNNLGEKTENDREIENRVGEKEKTIVMAQQQWKHHTK